MHRPSLFIGKKHFNCEEALRYIQRELGGTGIKANTLDDYYLLYKINIHIPVPGSSSSSRSFIFYLLRFALLFVSELLG